MRYFKIHWLHSFTDEPEYILSEIDEEAEVMQTIEIPKSEFYNVWLRYNSD